MVFLSDIFLFQKLILIFSYLLRILKNNNMKDQFDELKSIVANIEEDVKKFNDNNNKTAGLRVRKSMQDIKLIAQEIRKIILDKKNGKLS
jgi:hypothetical protein